MKYLKYFIILLLIPFIVLAEECDISKITITSLEKNNVEGNTEVISEPTFEGRNINLNLKMFEVGDSITYDMTIKNDSEEDYMIDEDTFKTDSDYIEYSLKINDNSNVVKAQSSKDVSLTVTYKKEVEDNMLNGNKFDASNNLKLSLNTNEKEKQLETIVTDNIKESVAPMEVSNPQTEVSNIKLIVAILVLVTMIILFSIYTKKQYVKYFIILIPLFVIPVVYAICKCDIEVDSTIEIEKIKKAANEIIKMADEENSCIVKYEGDVTEEVGKTNPATRVYFDKCLDKRNLIFGGYCWQVIRTTETGGLKVAFNGEPVDGKCESTRENHLGFVQPSLSEKQNISSEYIYGSSFTMDTTTNTFTLIDTFSETWSTATYENLMGKYTCKSPSETTCSTLYLVNGYAGNVSAYVSFYNISPINYSAIGKSTFNSNSDSPATGGYMFNKSHRVQEKYLTSGVNRTYTYGHSYNYDSNTDTYTLENTINITQWSGNNKKTSDYHYTCWNDTGSCSTLAYIAYTNGNYAYYYNLTEGKDIDDLLDEMFFAEDVNKYDSSVKNLLDVWYSHNFTNYTDRLENIVYCSNRGIKTLNGFDPNGGNVTYDMYFDNDYTRLSLACPRITDQFALDNNKAKLTYPVALITASEINNINSQNLTRTGINWWGMAPYSTHVGETSLSSVSQYGGRETGPVRYLYGIRPIISLNSENIISSGTGSETDPWIIE